MKNSFVEILLCELGKLFAPLLVLDTKEEIKDLLKELGWEVNDSSINVNDYTTIVTETKTLLNLIRDLPNKQTQNEKIEALKGIGIQTGKVVKAVNDKLPAIKTSIQQLTSGSSSDIAKKLPRRLGDYLVYTYLKTYYPIVFASKHLLGMAEEVKDDAGKMIKTIQWQRIPKIFSRPIEVFDAVYNWSINFENGLAEDYVDKFLTRFENLIMAIGIPGGIYDQTATVSTNLNRPSGSKEIRMPIFQRGDWPDTWRELDLNLSPIPVSGSDKPGLFLYPYFYGGVSFNDDISTQWTLKLEGDTDLGSGFGLGVRPPAKFEVKSNILSGPTILNNLDVQLHIDKKEPSSKAYIFGNPNTTNLSVGTYGIYAFILKKGSTESDFGVEMYVKKLRLEVKPGEGDGFVNKILPKNGFATEADLTAGYSLIKGFYFKGSATLEIEIPVHFTLGPLKSKGLKIGFSPKSEGFLVGLGSTLEVELGPFYAVVEGIGLNTKLLFPPEDITDFKGFDLKTNFKPPTGLGLSIDATAISGGGYLACYPEEKKYTGVAALSIKEKVAIKAIGILNTELPGGEKGYSLLLVIMAEFTPIQLGFGFTLMGVGGIIGLHRSVNLDVLRSGLRTKAFDNLLFPVDPVKNAPAIISGLQAIFPLAKDRYAFGIMAKLGWGSPTLITVDMGLIIEVPNPVRLAILGVIKAIIPNEDNPKIQLRCNFLGIIEFEKKRLSFDASIFDSKIMTLSLEGDMALRVNWGSKPSFLLSVGGFHPSFQAPDDLRSMKRMTINLLSGDNPRIILSSYFAVTSNTVQFGSRVDVFVKVSDKLTADGFMGFDALFQFKPFYFTIAAYAYLSLKWKGKEKMTLSLNIALEGPTPYKLNGEGEVTILGIDFKVRVVKTWGELDNSTVATVTVSGKLTDVLSELQNWNSYLPAGRLAPVVLRKQNSMAGLLHPMADLRISQTVLPLGVNIQRFGNNSVSDGGTFDIDVANMKVGTTTLGSSERTKENFAPAQYRNMSDNEKLSSPSFELFTGGVLARKTGFAFGKNSGNTMLVKNKPVEHELIVLGANAALNSNPIPMSDDLVNAAIKSGPSASTAFSATVSTPTVLSPKPLAIKQTKHAVVRVSDMRRFSDTNYPVKPDADSFSQASDQYRVLVQQNPYLKTQIQIVPASQAKI